MNIKVLGTGCTKCKKLEQLTREAVSELGIDATIEKVEDIQKIMEYGIMTTPALIVDGDIIVRGKLPSLKEIKSFLS